MPVTGILDDSEDREEDDETFEEKKSVASVSHAATCARPRAPGFEGLLRRRTHASYCKHFAWSSRARFVVLRAFRV